MTFQKGQYVPPREDVPPTAPDGMLLVADIAKMLNVKPQTVLAYRKESKPMVGNKPGRYADNPFPPPRGRLAPTTALWWHRDDEKAIREWDKARLTQSHGKGRQVPGPRGRQRPKGS